MNSLSPLKQSINVEPASFRPNKVTNFESKSLKKIPIRIQLTDFSFPPQSQLFQSQSIVSLSKNQSYSSESYDFNSLSNKLFEPQIIELKQQIEVQRLDKQQLEWKFCCSNINAKKIYFSFLTKQNELILINKNTNIIEYYFNFNSVLCEVRINKENQNQIIMKSGFLILSFKKEQNLQKLWKWGQILRLKVTNGLGYKHKLKLLHSINNFYENRYKLEKQFCNQCRTGDLILFQGFSLTSKVVRILTHSDYDHIAMIVRDSLSNVFLYEANSTTGVTIVPWTVFLTRKIYNNIKKIAWRKLENVERTFGFISKIQSFIKDNVKAQYHISINKLLSENSYNGEIKGEEGYFCSELIAKIYKTLGLLPTDEQEKHYKPSSKYFPVHFSDKRPLKLIKGSLSKQYQILFFEDLLSER